MGLVFFSWVDLDGNASNLLIDASTGRTHTSSAQVTEHAVERGTPATDNIRPLPRRLTVECLITNTPLGTPPEGASDGVTASLELVEREMTLFNGKPQKFGWNAVRFSATFDRVQNSFLMLVDAVIHGNIFAITTSLSNYSNMAATNMTVTETTHGTQALQFTIEFQELRIVERGATVIVPARQKKQDTGHKAPETADDSQDHVLRDTVRAVTNFFGITSPGQ